jgi:hypothetical protein
MRNVLIDAGSMGDAYAYRGSLEVTQPGGFIQGAVDRLPGALCPILMRR